MAEANPPLDAELCTGFVSWRPAAEIALIERLRPYLRQEIRRQFPSLWRWSEDLQQSAFLKLCELRKSDAAKIQPPLDELAIILIDTPAQVMLRSAKHMSQSVSLKEFHGRVRPDQDASTRLRELFELFASKLDAGEASILLVHAAHEMGDGPPLHEVLGITKDGAKRKLLQAQDALLTLSRNEADHE